MSGSKLGNTNVFQPVTVQSQTTRLSLPASAVQFSKNGIEFRTPTPIPAWTEMTVDVQTPLEAKKLRCTGVIVACNGSRHAGYVVSMLFTGVSRQNQERLSSLAYSR